GLESVHVHRQLCRSHDVRKINKLPSRQLRAITKIEIFAQRIVLPAAALFDTRASPETGWSIEIEKSAAATARRLFEQEMPIQENSLHAGEQRIPTIQMPPAGLDHSHFRVRKIVNGSLQQILLRNKIGVEDTNEFSFGSVKPY